MTTTTARPAAALTAILTATLALALGACGPRADPALTNEALLGSSGARPADRAIGAAEGDGAVVARDACSGDPVVAGPGWVGRLPAAFPVYPGASVVEAGGVERGCGLRRVVFTTDAPRPAVLGWYAQRARAAGFGVDRQDRGAARVIGGMRGDAAFVVAATVVGGGSRVELLANAGR